MKITSILDEPTPGELVRYRSFGSPLKGGADEQEIYDSLLGRLRFKDVTTFNDPFEARPHHIAAHADAAEQREAMIRYLTEIQPEGISKVARRKRAELIIRGKGQQEIIDYLSDLLARRDCRGEAFVFCLMDPVTISTPLPWSHYADSHRGVCVNFDATQLPIKLALPVTYGDDYPTITIPRSSNEEELSQTLLRKAAGWSYEREWRVIQLRIEQAGISRSLFGEWEGDTAIASPRIVRAVTVGCCMNDETIGRLIAWIKQHAEHVEVWQARRNRTSYRLDRDRIT